MEALAPSRRAAEYAPDDASAALNLGILLSKLGRLREAEVELRRAVVLAPDSPPTNLSLAENLLAQGRYREGWSLYEARESIPELSAGFPRNFPFPRWRGEPLEGKRLAIFPEQGLGDQIQLVRFLPRVIARAGAVTMLTKRPLERLLRHNFPEAEIVVAEGKVEFPDPDYWTTLYGLPAIFGVELDNIPADPYLRAPGASPPQGNGFKVGLKLKGNPKHVNDRMRSLSDVCASDLRQRLPGTVVSLEPDESGASDMLDTAAIVDGLDLVVSVDTSVAHLAGALGKPCLLLVPGFSTDWRWMQTRSDSPWYPGHKIYRGDVDGDWRGAIDRLVGAAKAHAALTKPAASSPKALGKTSPDPVAQLLFQAESLRCQARYSEALEVARRAVKLAPGNAGPLSVVGTLLANVGQLEEAEQFQRRAVELAPGYPAFRYDLALNLLAQGRYREAWPLYEARAEVSSLKSGFPKQVPGRRWRGEPIGGKHIVILPEQGFGDEIQFARFIPELQRRGCRITLFTKPPLVSLFEASLPGVAVRSASGTVQLGEPDYWTTLVDMAQPLDVALDTLPRLPYLRADRTWPDLPSGFKVGLCTSGNPRHANDGWRSLPPEAAARLRAGLPGWVFGLDPTESGARDFADTAALIQGMDLIVSVDTSVAHLAGALGKPVLLLVPNIASDWRWMRGRANSAWYAGHRLYRGALDGKWDTAIDRVIADARDAAGMPAPSGADVAPVVRSKLESSGGASGAPNNAVPRVRDGAVEQLSRRGVLLTKRGELAKGEALLRQALSVAGGQNDQIRYDLALNLLEQGRYAEAWPLYGARRNLPRLGIGYPQIQGPRWQGQDLAGKRLLVLPEQGMGDTLQLARFLPQLLDKGATITLFERAPLVRLLRSAFPAIRVEDVTRITEAGPQDYWVSSFDLLEALDVSLESLPSPNYITVPGRSSQDLLFRIGLCTAGNPKHKNDAMRSLSPKRARDLQARLYGEIVDLRPEATNAVDFLDTAAIMAGLDLIVSVDTSIAHLAGVIDKPCLLLVPGFSTDWRWMRGRSDCPWYPRHMLFRSDVNGDWKAAIDALVMRCNEIAAARQL